MSNTKKIYIAKEAIAEIAYTAALTVEGVCDLVKINPRSIAVSRKNKKNFVQVENINESLEITLNLKLSQNSNINEVPKKVQQKVKEDVQNITSSIVSKVNINITDLDEQLSEEKTN